MNSTEELTRYEVRMYAPQGSKEQDIETFTWALSYRQAQARVAEQFDRGEVWNGWSFAVVPKPVAHPPTWPNYIDNPA